MNIGLISVFKKPLASKISFGELDGEPYSQWYSTPKMSRAEYNAKKSAINEKYDDKRSLWFHDADDIGIDNSAFYAQLSRIEELRNIELSKLEAEYRR